LQAAFFLSLRSRYGKPNYKPATVFYFLVPLSLEAGGWWFWWRGFFLGSEQLLFASLTSPNFRWKKNLANVLLQKENPRNIPL